MDGGVAAGGRPQHCIGVGDVAGHDFDAERRQRCGVRRLAGQCPHRIAPLDQQLADVGAGQPGGSRDQDRLRHVDALDRAVGDGRVDLIGAVGDDRRAFPEHVQRVDEAVQSHGVGAGESELDDLCRGEDLAQPPVELVVDGVVIGREEIEELHGQPLLVGQVRSTGGDQARDVLVGDGVVLPRLHAGLALAQLGAADAQELEDPSPQQRLLAPGAACSVGHQDLRRLVGEDLQGDGRGVGAVGHSLFDDPPWLRRQLLQRNRLNSRHATPRLSPASAGVNSLVR